MRRSARVFQADFVQCQITLQREALARLSFHSWLSSERALKIACLRRSACRRTSPSANCVRSTDCIVFVARRLRGSHSDHCDGRNQYLVFIDSPSNTDTAQGSGKFRQHFENGYYHYVGACGRSRRLYNLRILMSVGHEDDALDDEARIRPQKR